MVGGRNNLGQGVIMVKLALILSILLSLGAFSICKNSKISIQLGISEETREEAWKNPGERVPLGEGDSAVVTEYDGNGGVKDVVFLSSGYYAEDLDWSFEIKSYGGGYSKPVYLHFNWTPGGIVSEAQLGGVYVGPPGVASKQKPISFSIVCEHFDLFE